MAYSFHDRLDRHGVRAKELNNETVVWMRKEGLSVITGEVIVSFVGLDTQEFMPAIDITEAQFQDIIVTVTDLVINDVQTMPQASDRIVRTNGQVYKVVAATGGRYNSQEAPYIFTTSTRKRIRVHLVEVSPDDAS